MLFVLGFKGTNYSPFFSLKHDLYSSGENCNYKVTFIDHLRKPLYEHPKYLEFGRGTSGVANQEAGFETAYKSPIS